MGKWAISVFQKGSRRLEEPGPMWTGPSWELMRSQGSNPGGSILWVRPNTVLCNLSGTLQACGASHEPCVGVERLDLTPPRTPRPD
eukprot:1158446-Pelagomonas_calceolata.AAC.4